MDDVSPIDDRLTEGEISLAEAAHRLGVTVESLRKRVQRGKTLRGRKVGEQWYVPRAEVDAEVSASTAPPWTHPDAGNPSVAEPSSPPPETASGHALPTCEPGQDAAWTQADMLERELSLTRELLDVERDRRERAERMADEQIQANAELRRLLAVAMQGRALPAPSGGQDVSGEPAPHGQATSPSTSGPRSHRPTSPLARWLRDWLGP